MHFQKTSIALIVILFLLFFKCSDKEENAHLITNPNEELGSLFTTYGNNIAVLSCLRCQCFIRSYNKQYALFHKKPENYILLADTICNRFLFPVKYIGSAQVERISEDFYNVVFIKKRNNGIAYRIISIEESDKIDKVAKTFFQDN